MVEHLSYSSISLYQTCGRAWCYKYIEQAPTRQTAALVFGSAIHDAIEAIASRNSEPTQAWQAAWERQVGLNRDLDWGDDTPETLNNDGIRMLNHPDVLAGIRALRPAAIERRVELRVPGVDVPVIGYIDLIGEDGVPGDIKTSAKTWSQEQAQAEVQPLFYLAALNQSGEPVRDGLFRHYVLVKTKTPQWQVWETRHTNAEIFWLFRMITDVWTGIERGVFVPNPGSWRCSPKWCDFWWQCRGKG